MIHSEFLKELTTYLPHNEIDPFLESCMRPLKKSISINTAKCSIERFIELTHPRGRHLTPHGFSDHTTTFFIDRDDTTLALGKTFLHQSGFFYIQEVAASMPATLLDLHGGERILDMAAAPGGKTSQIAASLLTTGKPGLVIANDVAGPRLQTLAHNLNKGGFYNSALSKFNGFAFGKNLPGFFDHVLVDAPCSGEGTGYKSDVAMKFWKKEEINKIAGTQFQLLVSAIKATKVGGTILYSTCTLNPYENEEILGRVLDFFEGTVILEPTGLHASPGLSRVDSVDPSKVSRFWPHLQGTGGFFVSKLRKTEEKDMKAIKDHKLLPKNQFKLDMTSGLQKRVMTWLKESYGISVDPEQHFFVATKENIYLTSPAFTQVQPHLHVEKVGVPVIKIDDHTGRRPTHYTGNILGHRAVKNTIPLSSDSMQQYSEGITIPFLHQDSITTQTGYGIITRDHFGMSVGKVTGNELKNKFLKS